MFKNPAIVHCLELDVGDNFGLGTHAPMGGVSARV